MRFALVFITWVTFIAAVIVKMEGLSILSDVLISTVLTCYMFEELDVVGKRFLRKRRGGGM